MKVEYSNKWFRETCKENGLDPDNSESRISVMLAKEHSKKMKYFMDFAKNIDDQYPLAADEIKKNITQLIERHNQQRMAYMLQAMKEAEKHSKKNSETISKFKEVERNRFK